MAIEGKSVLAVVPARGGSKSIPRKNLAEVCGVSLVGHAGLTLGKLDWVDAAVLSTDDEEIAEEGKKYGLDVPFLRPEELASDTATSLDMWRHVWKQCEEFYGMTFDISLLLEPTSPLRRPEDIEQTALEVVRNGCPAAVTVSPTPAHFTPEKTLLLDEDNNITYYIGQEGHKFHNRQAIPSYYHRNGICYALTRHRLLDEGIILQGAHPIVIDRPIVNIDELVELEMASWFMKRQS